MNGSQSRTATADAARLDIVLEALEIFTHDLSNPLQSLIVLTELALDDATPHSEDEVRCRQTLEAADRMRTLVAGLAGLTRGGDGPRSTRTSVERFTEALSRRWERHRIEVKVELGPAEHTPSPPELDVALLNMGLGVVAAAGDKMGGFLLTVRGLALDPDGPEQRYALEISLEARSPDGGLSPVSLSDENLGRSDRLLASSSLRVQRFADRVSLEFSAGAMR